MKTAITENVASVASTSLVLDLPADRKELLRAHAEGCYDRFLELSESRFWQGWKPIARQEWVANCMQDALNHIGKSESWERIESVVSLQNDQAELRP